LSLTGIKTRSKQATLALQLHVFLHKTLLLCNKWSM